MQRLLLAILAPGSPGHRTTGLPLIAFFLLRSLPTADADSFPRNSGKVLAASLQILLPPALA